MLCYKDKTYCLPKDCSNTRCYNRLTDKIKNAAARQGLPICTSDYTDVCRYRITATDNVCGNCKHFLGCGDWNLCCELHRGLYYEKTPACELFILKV